MIRRLRQVLLFIVVGGVVAFGAWALLRANALKRQPPSQFDNPSSILSADADLWTRAIEKVKEDRGGGAIEIPSQLRHYEDRHWFLATQVAEVRKLNLRSSQDFVDLAAMIRRGELVSLPAVTDNYILYGVGAKADNGVFSRYVDDHNLDLYDETELRDAYGRLESTRLKLETEISHLKSQLVALKRSERTKQAELHKEINAREEELKTNSEEKALLDQSYGQPESRQQLLRDYESLQTLAKNFAGRSFNLDVPSDRQAMKVTMLSSIRPEALKILEEVAKNYHDKFDRRLPISSLVRPEQYQHALRRVNRNAVLIDTPPHSTGLAFDIDYRYMSGAEQTFLMMDLARLKDDGRIEVIRERNSNYHVFAFLDGQRPSDDLITASLDEVTLEPQEANHATKTPAKEIPSPQKPAKIESKSRTAKTSKTNSKSKHTARSKAKKHR
jgi:hypothetical protein